MRLTLITKKISGELLPNHREQRISLRNLYIRGG